MQKDSIRSSNEQDEASQSLVTELRDLLSKAQTLTEKREKLMAELQQLDEETRQVNQQIQQKRIQLRSHTRRGRTFLEGLSNPDEKKENNTSTPQLFLPTVPSSPRPVGGIVIGESKSMTSVVPRQNRESKKKLDRVLGKNLKNFFRIEWIFQKKGILMPISFRF